MASKKKTRRSKFTSFGSPSDEARNEAGKKKIYHQLSEDRVRRAKESSDKYDREEAKLARAKKAHAARKASAVGAVAQKKTSAKKKKS